MHTRWQRVTVALVYPALPRSPFILSLQSVMLCVTSHKCQCHHGTVINFGVLGKMSSRCLFGLSFSHPLAHPLSLCVLESWVESGKRIPPTPLLSSQPSPHAVTASSPSFGRRGQLIIIEGQRLPELTEIFFSDQNHLLPPPSSTPQSPCAVCLVCAGGV